MEKIKSLKKGNIWLNVFKTDDGQLVATINKTYLRRNGEWDQTPFLNSRRGDIRDLMDVLFEFHEFEKMVEGQRGAIAPSLGYNLTREGAYDSLLEVMKK
jgi:hypothetical protein